MGFYASQGCKKPPPPPSSQVLHLGQLCTNMALALSAMVWSWALEVSVWDTKVT